MGIFDNLPGNNGGGTPSSQNQNPEDDRVRRWAERFRGMAPAFGASTNSQIPNDPRYDAWGITTPIMQDEIIGTARALRSFVPEYAGVPEAEIVTNIREVLDSPDPQRRTRMISRIRETVPLFSPQDEGHVEQSLRMMFYPQSVRRGGIQPVAQVPALSRPNLRAIRTSEVIEGAKQVAPKTPQDNAILRTWEKKDPKQADTVRQLGEYGAAMKRAESARGTMSGLGLVDSRGRVSGGVGDMVGAPAVQGGGMGAPRTTPTMPAPAVTRPGEVAVMPEMVSTATAPGMQDTQEWFAGQQPVAQAGFLDYLNQAQSLRDQRVRDAMNYANQVQEPIGGESWRTLPGEANARAESLYSALTPGGIALTGHGARQAVEAIPREVRMSEMQRIKAVAAQKLAEIEKALAERPQIDPTPAQLLTDPTAIRNLDPERRMLMQAADTYRQILNASEDDDSFWQGMLRGGKASMNVENIPLLGIPATLEREMLEQKATDNPNLTPGTRALFEGLGLQNASKAVEPFSIGRVGTETGIQMVPYMLEFVATGPIARSVEGVVAKGAAKMLSRAAEKSIIRKGVQKLVGPIGKGLGATVQSMVNVPALAADVLQRTTDQYSAVLEGDQVTGYTKQDGDEFGKALAKAVATRAVDFMTESMGETLVKPLAKAKEEFAANFMRLMEGSAGKDWTRRTMQLAKSTWLSRRGATAQNAIAMLKRAGKWDGIAGEFAEELAAIAPTNIIEGRPITEGFTPENMAAILLGVGGFGGALNMGQMLAGGDRGQKQEEPSTPNIGMTEGTRAKMQNVASQWGADAGDPLPFDGRPSATGPEPIIGGGRAQGQNIIVPRGTSGPVLNAEGREVASSELVDAISGLTRKDQDVMMRQMGFVRSGTGFVRAQHAEIETPKRQGGGTLAGLGLVTPPKERQDRTVGGLWQLPRPVGEAGSIEDEVERGEARRAALAEMEAKTPVNEPIVIEDQGLFHIITKNMGEDRKENPWRTSTISKRDRMPGGHTTYKTRLDALKDISPQATRRGDIPFQVEPLPPNQRNVAPKPTAEVQQVPEPTAPAPPETAPEARQDEIDPADMTKDEYEVVYREKRRQALTGALEAIRSALRKGKPIYLRTAKNVRPFKDPETLQITKDGQDLWFTSRVKGKGTFLFPYQVADMAAQAGHELKMPELHSEAVRRRVSKDFDWKSPLGQRYAQEHPDVVAGYMDQEEEYDPRDFASSMPPSVETTGGDSAPSLDHESIVNAVESAINQRERSNVLMKIGAASVPGLRLGDTENAGLWAYHVARGEATQEEFDKQIDEWERENRFTTPRVKKKPVPPLQGLGLTKPEIDDAANVAATSSKNDLPEPTEAQKEAGNYKKGEITIHGMTIKIENPAGSVREGTDAKGKPWRTVMKHHYGYVQGSKGADGDPVDVFIGDHPESDTVFVIEQINPRTRKFDEHKAVLGALTEEEARETYLANYEKGWKGLKAVKAMPLATFKMWAQALGKDVAAPPKAETPPATNAPQEEQPVQASDIDGWISSIKNQAKKQYAEAYRKFVENGGMEPKPNKYLPKTAVDDVQSNVRSLATRRVFDRITYGGTKYDAVKVGDGMVELRSVAKGDDGKPMSTLTITAQQYEAEARKRANRVKAGKRRFADNTLITPAMLERMPALRAILGRNVDQVEKGYLEQFEGVRIGSSMVGGKPVLTADPNKPVNHDLVHEFLLESDDPIHNAWYHEGLTFDDLVEKAVVEIIHRDDAPNDAESDEDESQDPMFDDIINGTDRIVSGEQSFDDLLDDLNDIEVSDQGSYPASWDEIPPDEEDFNVFEPQAAYNAGEDGPQWTGEEPDNWMKATGDVVRGDIIRFTEAVFTKATKPKFMGDRTITARIVNDSYGSAKQQHTFTLEVLDATGEDAKSVLGKDKILRKGRNVYRNGTLRLPWDDESKRVEAADEKHRRGDVARRQRDDRRAGMVRESQSPYGAESAKALDARFADLERRAMAGDTEAAAEAHLMVRMKAIAGGYDSHLVYHGTPDTRKFKTHPVFDDTEWVDVVVDQKLRDELRAKMIAEENRDDWPATLDAYRDLQEQMAGTVRREEQIKPAFFTPDARVARTYADERRLWDSAGAEPGLMRTYLSLRNPKFINAGGVGWGKRGGYAAQIAQIAQAKAEGHDGMIIRRTRDTYENTNKDPVHDVYVTFSPEQVKSAETFTYDKKGKLIPLSKRFDPINPSILYDPIRAYHGTPKRWDDERFSNEKVGDANGLAFGWGAYLAQNKKVGDKYADLMSREPGFYEWSTVDGGTVRLLYDWGFGVHDLVPRRLAQIASARTFLRDVVGVDDVDYVVPYNEEPGKVAAVQSDTLNNVLETAIRTSEYIELSSIINGLRREAESYVQVANEYRNSEKVRESSREYARAIHQVADAIEKVAHEHPKRSKIGSRYFIGKPVGTMYSVRGPEEEQFLLWEKPLSGQAEFVQERIPQILDHLESMGFHADEEQIQKATGKDLYFWLAGAYEGDIEPKPYARDLWTGMDYDAEAMKSASLWLDSIGIRGNKYLDGFSRDEGEGTYNYVVFNPEGELEILDALYEPRSEYVAHGGPYITSFPREAQAKIITAANVLFDTGYRTFEAFDTALRAKFPEKLHPFIPDIWNVVLQARGIMAQQETPSGGETPPETSEKPKTRRPGIQLVRGANLPVPRDVVGKQYNIDEHQRLAVNLALTRLIDKEGNFLLADGVGVGKTREELVIASEYAKKSGKPSLIVTQSKTVIQSSFMPEIEALGLSMDDVEIGTYDDLRAGKVGGGEYGVVVYDEAHNLKNRESQRTMASRAVSSERVVYATATPFDRPESAVHLLSAVMGTTEDFMLAMVGMHWETITSRDPYSGKETQQTRLAPDPGLSYDRVWQNIQGLRQDMIEQGAMVRREYPIWATWETQNVPLTRSDLAEQAQIVEYWALRMANVRDINVRRNLGGRRLMDLSRWLESKKIIPVADLVEKELAEGRSVVVASEAGLNEMTIAALDNLKVTGVLDGVMRELGKRGIEFSRVFANGGKEKIDRAEEIRKFQTGKTRVLVMTSASGGTGVNLDDTTGDRPRTLVKISLPYAGDMDEQINGRVSRRNTASQSRIIDMLSVDGLADARRLEIVETKRATLRSIQQGGDLDEQQWKDYTKDREGAKQATPGGRVPRVRIENYSDKSIIVTGDTYPLLSTFKELKRDLGVGMWNSKAKGWIFPARFAPEVERAMAQYIEREGGLVMEPRASYAPNRPSVTPEEDAEYAKAVERGDTSEAKRILFKAAKRAGYTDLAFTGQKPRVVKFPKVERNSLPFAHSFLSSSEEMVDVAYADIESGWTNGQKRSKYRVLLKLENTLDLDQSIYPHEQWFIDAIADSTGWYSELYNNLENYYSKKKISALMELYGTEDLDELADKIYEEGTSDYARFAKRCATYGHFGYTWDSEYEAEPYEDSEVELQWKGKLHWRFEGYDGETYDRDEIGTLGDVVERVWKVPEKMFEYKMQLGVALTDCPLGQILVLSPPDVAERFVKEGGYDSYSHSDYELARTTTVIVFSMNQIKSAEIEKTRDGRLIPLSKRFNPERASILYEPQSQYNPDQMDLFDRSTADQYESQPSQQIDLFGLPVDDTPTTVDLPEPKTEEEPKPKQKKKPVGATQGLLGIAPEQRQIEDFGEKIGGARKDLYAEGRLKASDLDDMNEREAYKLTTKDMVWPKIPYAEWVESGVDPVAAMLVKKIRDAIPLRPADSDEARKQFIESVTVVRDIAREVKTVEDAKSLFKSLIDGERGIARQEKADRADLLSQYVDLIDGWGKRGGRPKRFTPEVEAFLRPLGRAAISAMQISPYDVVHAKRVVEETGWPTGEAWRKKWTLKHFQADNENPEVYAITRGPYILAEFPTEAEAVAWARAKYEEENAKKKPPEKGKTVYLNQIQRIGIDYRNGKDVAEQDFQDVFGFRGGEFGNWLNDSERQEALNHAYDALMDLARVLNIPPKALSLDGNLAIAFGARGKGGAAAHYEPTRRVINLTKLSGAGSLAHEWAHAFDDYLAYALVGLSGGRTQMLSEIQQENSRLAIKKGLRPEMAEAWRAINRAILYTTESSEESLKPIKAKLENSEWAGRDLHKNIIAVIEGNRDVVEQALAKLPDTGTPPDGMTRVDWLLTAFDQKAFERWDDSAEAAFFRIIGFLKKNIGARDKTNGILRILGDRKYYSPGNFRNSRFWNQEYHREIAEIISGELTKLTGTDFVKWAEKKGPYWKRPEELFARAFESYILDRILTSGRSDYLVNTAKGDVELRGQYPSGKEREAINAAFDALVATMQTKETEKGVMLYERQGEYGSGSIRKSVRGEVSLGGRRDADAGPASPDEAERLLGADRVGGRISHVAYSKRALSWNEEIEKHGIAQIIGAPVGDATDMAELLQVLRNAQYETFRLVFTKNGKVVEILSLTSRMPEAVAIPYWTTEEALKIGRRIGADGMYITHNHPSGEPRPSQADVEKTREIANAVARYNATHSRPIAFHGHIVTDHGQFYLVDSAGRPERMSIPDVARTPDPMIAQNLGAIGGPNDIARVVRNLGMGPTGDAIIYASTHGRIIMVVHPQGRVVRGAIVRTRLAVGATDVYYVHATRDVKDVAGTARELKRMVDTLPASTFRDVVIVGSEALSGRMSAMEQRLLPGVSPFYGDLGNAIHAPAEFVRGTEQIAPAMPEDMGQVDLFGNPILKPEKSMSDRLSELYHEMDRLEKIRPDVNEPNFLVWRRRFDQVQHELSRLNGRGLNRDSEVREGSLFDTDEGNLDLFGNPVAPQRREEDPLTPLDEQLARRNEGDARRLRALHDELRRLRAMQGKIPSKNMVAWRRRIEQVQRDISRLLQRGDSDLFAPDTGQDELFEPQRGYRADPEKRIIQDEIRRLRRAYAQNVDNMAKAEFPKTHARREIRDIPVSDRTEEQQNALRESRMVRIGDIPFLLKYLGGEGNLIISQNVLEKILTDYHYNEVKDGHSVPDAVFQSALRRLAEPALIVKNPDGHAAQDNIVVITGDAIDNAKNDQSLLAVVLNIHATNVNVPAVAVATAYPISASQINEKANRDKVLYYDPRRYASLKRTERKLNDVPVGDGVPTRANVEKQQWKGIKESGLTHLRERSLLLEGPNRNANLDTGEDDVKFPEGKKSPFFDGETASLGIEAYGDRTYNRSTEEGKFREGVTGVLGMSSSEASSTWDGTVVYVGERPPTDEQYQDLSSGATNGFVSVVVPGENTGGDSWGKRRSAALQEPSVVEVLPNRGETVTHFMKRIDEAVQKVRAASNGGGVLREPQSPYGEESARDLDARFADLERRAKEGDVEAGEEAASMVRAKARENGYVIASAYHGTSRIDRLGDRIDPKRSTSGPMPFFTEDHGIAVRYSEEKRDNSLEIPPTYGEWFFVNVGRGKPVPITSAWRRLSEEQRETLRKNLPHVTDYDEDGNEFDEYRLNPKEFAPTGKDHWEWTIRENNGDVLSAAVELWLEGGILFNREAEFLEILRIAGLDGVTMNDPHATVPGVLHAALAITAPFDTSNISERDYDALLVASRGKRATRVYGADSWDKRTVSGAAWRARLMLDKRDGMSHAWTSIPDWVTATLRSLGYDGIRDTGGKYSGNAHTVWIPFVPSQVKSAETFTYDKRGRLIPLSKRFDPINPSILYDPIRAYHGTPMRWDEQKFLNDKIGVANGLAFGWGAYVAQSEAVSKKYAKTKITEGDRYVWPAVNGGTVELPNWWKYKKEGNRWVKNIYNFVDNARIFLRDVVGVKETIPSYEETEDVAVKFAETLNNITARSTYGYRDLISYIVRELRREAEWQNKLSTAYSATPEELERQHGLNRVFNQAADAVDKALREHPSLDKMFPEWKTGRPIGTVYDIRGPEEEQFLLWEKPLSEQTEFVKGRIPEIMEHLKSLGFRANDGEMNNITGKDLYFWLADASRGHEEPTGYNRHVWTGLDFDPSAMRSASLYLDSIGIKGNKYLDGFSRDTGEGTYNYVVFNPEGELEILDALYEPQSPYGDAQGMWEDSRVESPVALRNVNSQPAQKRGAVEIARAIREGLTKVIAPASVADRMALGVAGAAKYHNTRGDYQHIAVHGARETMTDELRRLLAMTERMNDPRRVMRWWRIFGRRMSLKRAVDHLQKVHEDALTAAGSVALWVKEGSNGVLEFGGRQRWGIIGADDVKAMKKAGSPLFPSLYPGMVLPDGRVVGETLDDGSVQLYRVKDRQEAALEWRNFIHRFPEAVPYVREYISLNGKIDRLQAIGRDIPILPFNRTAMLDYLKSIDPNFEPQEGVENYVHGLAAKRKKALGIVTALLRKRKADVLKHNRGILSAANARDYNLSRAQTMARLNYLTSTIKTEQAGVLLSIVARPWTPGTQPDSGYVPLSFDGLNWGAVRRMFAQTRQWWEARGDDVSDIISGTYAMEKRWQIPKDLEEELLGALRWDAGEVTKELTEIADLARRSVNGIINSVNATHLIRPGTAATNFISGELQLLQKTLTDAWYLALSGGSPDAWTEFRENVAVVFRRLSPSARARFAKTFPKEVFDKNFFSELGQDPMTGKPGVTSTLLIPFQAVETLFKARVWDMTIMAEVEKKLRRDPQYQAAGKTARKQMIEDALANPTSEILARAREVSDKYTYDYGDIPRWLAKLKRMTLFRAIIPYPTYAYKFASQLGKGLAGVRGFVPNTLRGAPGTVRAEIGLGKIGGRWEADNRVLRAMEKAGYTPDHLRQVSAFLATGGLLLSVAAMFGGGGGGDDDPPKIGTMLDKDGNPLTDLGDRKFDTSNRLLLHETEDALYYMRGMKYPWIREGIALVQMQRGEFDPGNVIGDMISVGSMFELALKAGGYSTKYNEEKPFGAMVGEKVAGDIPLGPIMNDAAVFVDPTLRRAYDRDAGFFQNVYMGFASKMPWLSKGLEARRDRQTGKDIESPRLLSAWNFLTGLRLKEVKKEERAIREVFGRTSMAAPAKATPTGEWWWKMLSDSDQAKVQENWPEIRRAVQRGYADIQKVRYEALVQARQYARNLGYTDAQMSVDAEDARKYAANVATAARVATLQAVLDEFGITLDEGLKDRRN